MLNDYQTALDGPAVLAQAKAFFAERVPHYGAYLEHEGSGHVTFRGQGGEEIAIAVVPAEHGCRVRGSSPLYQQAIARFFSTLPPAEVPAS